jgi:hypothetical protein
MFVENLLNVRQIRNFWKDIEIKDGYIWETKTFQYNIEQTAVELHKVEEKIIVLAWTQANIEQQAKQLDESITQKVNILTQDYKESPNVELDQKAREYAPYTIRQAQSS